MRIIRDTFVHSIPMSRHMVGVFGPGHRAGTVVIRGATGEEHRVSVSVRPDGRMVVSAVGWLPTARTAAGPSLQSLQRCLLVQERPGSDHAFSVLLDGGRVVPGIEVPLTLLRYMPDPVHASFAPGAIAG